MNRLIHLRFAHMVSFLLLAPLLVMLLSAGAVQAQTTTFTYQGRFTDSQNGGAATNGSYDFQFKLFDALNGGNQLGNTLDRGGVAVTNSAFTVQLDFGAGVFPGANRFLEISVRQAGSGSFSTLNPRQPVTSTPYSIRSLSAATADTANTANTANTATTANNALQLNGQAASQFVLTGDSRLSDARTPTAGSANYIQNTINQQANSNFNISGNGLASGALSANLINAATQFNLNGNRVLSSPAENLFVGIDAGKVNQGLRNAFFGQAAGIQNSTGSDNSFFGRQTGFANSTGILNSFYGTEAGPNNSTGSRNTFVGALAGRANTTGGSNSFFGQPVGTANTTGSANSFFGASAGEANTTGNLNTFMGAAAGDANTTGERNSYFGRAAGRGNAAGSRNTIIGDSASFGADNLSNATAIGANASVSQSNSLVLGSINGVNGATADTTVGIGTTTPVFKLTVVTPTGTQGFGLTDPTGTIRIASGIGANFGLFGTQTNHDLQFFTNNATQMTILANGNVGIGTFAASSRLTVAGVIESSTGGVKFPDGTVQTSAATSGNAIQNTTSQQANANFNISGNGTVGGTLTAGALSATNDTLLMRGKQALSNKGPSNVFAGEQAGAVSSLNTGGANSFFGAFSGIANTSGSLNTFIGVSAGGSNTTGDNLTLLGRSSNVGSSNLSNATAIGSKAQVSQSNALVLGSINGVNGATADTNVGIGTTAPVDRLTVVTPTGTPGITLTDGTVAISQVVGSGFAALGTRTNTPLTFFTNNGNAQLSLVPNGNFGIGTGNPLSKLHVASSLPKATVASARAFAVLTNNPLGNNGDPNNPFGLDIRLVGGAALADRAVILQATDFNTADGGNILLQPGGGRVGIGTTNPTRAKVEISGVSGAFLNVPRAGFLNEVTPAGLTPGGFTISNFSLFASDNIGANVYFAFSDKRIKRIAGRSDAARDLATLAGIEVTDYTYIDTLTKGGGKQKKVIAQQVETVYPQAVSLSADVVPDIYQKTTIKDGWVKLATNLRKGERVRLIGEKKEGVHEVLEVARDGFRTDFIADGDAVFVYGREVKDFRNVDYNAIAMLNVSATQELNRLVQQQAAELKAMKAENEAIKAVMAENEALNTRLAALEQMMQQLAGQQSKQAQPKQQ